MSKIYYTLRVLRNGLDQEIYNNGEEFDSFEAAYDKMCRLYFQQLQSFHDHFDGTINRYGIWRTSESEYNGRIDSMTQAVWR